MSESVLNELLKESFDEYQILWNDHHYHSHTAHHLGSLSLLGGTDEQLKGIYEKVLRHYSDEYEKSPHEITKENWRNSFGDGRFCLAYRNYFDSELPKEGDWKEKFFEILLNDKDGFPLIDGAYCGLFHPLIHIDYAIELNNRYVACEALTMSAVTMDSFQKITTKLNPPKNPSKEPLEIIKEIYLDDNVPVFDQPANFEGALKEESIILSYYNQWKMNNDLEKTIEQLFDMSVYIYSTTHKLDHIDFDFVILHLLTGLNAIIKIKSYLDENTLKKLLYSFFYATIVTYISQQQPQINQYLIDDYQIDDQKYNWDYVIDQTLNTKLSTEPHLVKVIRVLRDAENTYGSKNGLYLKTAIKTVDNLNLDIRWDYYKSIEPWVGTNTASRELNVKH